MLKTESAQSEQYSDWFLSNKRLIGDPEVDAFILDVFSEQIQKQKLHQWISEAKKTEHLYELKNIFSETNFIQTAGNLPDWADPNLMRIGSNLFIKHSTVIMSLLGLLSLPYCYMASNGARVLYLSERIRTDTTKRLYETAIFVWEVMAPNAFSRTGNAFTEIMKVRLMHAAVRHYTLKSGKWDDDWGTPINQEDMAGTNLSFSLIVLRGLKLLGFKINKSEQLAFLHLWNVIGSLSGLNDDLITPNHDKAQLLDNAISRRQFCISSHGKELAKSLTDHIISVNKSNVTSDEMLGLMRYLLTPKIADMLSIEAPDLPAFKITLVRAISFFKGLLPIGNHAHKYDKEYAFFQTQKPL